MTQPPNLLQGPEPVETADLHFKLSCKLKIFETETKYEGGHCCVLAVSQYYGLIFVGNRSGFSVIKTKALGSVIDSEKFPKRDVVVNVRPTHLAVDFSQKILAVVCSSKPGSLLIFYEIQSFACKNIAPLKITPISKLSQNPAAEVVDLTWQPNADGSLMICMSDGSVLALSQGAKDGPVFTVPNTTQATCFCWSPKGKQIVIGSASGTLSQYKPDLKVVKTLPPPPIYNGAAMVVSVLWISSFQFAVAYNDRANPESFPVITIVNAAKNEPISVINYDDITYSSTLFRNHQIYMTHQSAWNLIFVSSANSIEVAVLHSKDGSTWEQWLLGDASRAELPLNPDRQETFPLGWGFDFTSEESIPWGEGSLPPMPRLLLVSDEGVLCVFNVVNATGSAPQLCAPPKENLEDSLFTSSNKTSPPPNVEEPKPAVEAPESLLGTPPAFGNVKSSFAFKTSPGFGGFGAPQLQTAMPQGGSMTLQQQLEQQPAPQPQVSLTSPQKNQQPPVSSTQIPPSATPFSLSAPQFGFAFSFGGNSTSTTPNAKLAFPGSAPSTKVVTPQALPKPFTTPGDIFAGKTPPQSTPIKQSEVAAEKTVPAPGSAIKKTEEVVEAATEKERTGKGPAQGENPESSPPELAVVDDSVYLSALEEEIEHFNSELQQLSAKMENFSIQVGSDEDKTKMKKSIDGLYDFWKELKETTKGQSAEIHAVVMDLMEAFAWLEDARSRNLQRKIPSYIELKRSEELDPLSARHMNEIEHLEYYIKNQLKQLTSYLEREWMDHQENYRNEVKKKMAVPPLEEVYKTMHYQLKILHKQKALVEELKEKMAVKKRKNKPQSFLVSADDPASIQQNGNRVSELSKLAENLLQLKINKEENSSRAVALEMMKSQLSAISERSRKLTRGKQNALRDALSECDTIKIRPVKTTLASSSFLRSLALEKVAQKTAKVKSQKEPGDAKKTEKGPAVGAKVEDGSNATVKPLLKPVRSEEKTGNAMKVEMPRNETAPPERPQIPLTVQSLAEAEAKSPLASLSGIVSSIGRKSEMEPPQAFAFGKSDQGKEPIVFGAVKSDPKQEKPKTTQTFTFGASKLAEPIFGAKPSFGVANLAPVVTITKPDLAKISAAPSVTITPVTTAPATTTTGTPAPASSFTFWSPATTASSTNLPKMNLQFTGKEQNSGIGSSTVKTTGNLFSVPSAVTQSSASPFSPGMSIFGGGKAPTSTFASSSICLFDAGKTTTEPSSQPSGFAFTQPPDNKAVTPKSGTTATPVKPTSETEDVDVVKIENPVKKPESSSEKSKDSPKATVPSGIFGSPLPVPSPKTAVEVTATPSPPSFTFVTSQSSNAGNAFVKSVATTAGVTTTTSDSTTPAVVSSTTTPATTATTTSTTPTTSTSSSTFSFSKAFGQTATTTTATTTTSVFGTPTTAANVFGQVSSTTPTKSIFEGSAKTTPTSNIFGGGSPNTSTGGAFGGSTPAKPIFGQAAATPSTTTASIFGGSTPTTNSFGQVSTPSTPPGFGQKPDAVSQATNLFGQLFGSGSPSATPTTASNIFSTPKNVFGGGGGGGGGASTTTASLFGATSSSSSSSPIFSQTTSVFRRSTTSSKVFGQAQNSSMSFFGQNICSPFGGGTSVTSNQSTFESGGFSKPIFGQSAFSQTTSNTSIFGGSPNNSSLFGGTSSTTSSNVFQTPTTSTTFGSTTPGPFSGGASSFRENSFGSTGSPFQKPLGGFGSPPVFGGVPAFGGSPTYGGSPTFGSVPAFGSVSQGTFGQSSSGSTTFENLANQNTIGFGNLAQQSQSQSFGGGFAAPAFENKSAFGGNSFSNWRSK